MIRAYRLVVFALALFYFTDRALIANWSDFGGMFRYLTIWGLTGNLLAAAAMLVPGFGRPNGRLDALLSVNAILSALVVASYWRLYFINPSLIYGDNEIVFWRDYYYHLIGPVLMWIDFFLIKRGFRRILPALIGLVVLVIAYVAWVELLVGPLNDTPVGSVTSGLSYPFLNDMTLMQRMQFYAVTCAAGAVFVLLFRAHAWIRDRLYPSSASSALSPER